MNSHENVTQVNKIVNESSTVGEKGEIIRVSVSTEQSHQAIVEGKFSCLNLDDESPTSFDEKCTEKIFFHLIINKHKCV